MISFTAIMAGLRAFARTFPLKVWLLIGGVLCVLAFGGHCAHEAREAEQARQAEKTAKVVTRNTETHGQAADERLTDERSNTQAEKELANAVASLPDALPSDRRLALACGRLRRQGSDLPARCGPEG